MKRLIQLGLTAATMALMANSANAEVQPIGSVLKAAPNLNVSITAYGATQDNGLAKANSIKSALTSTGISTDRVLARGETGSGAPSMRLMK